MKQFITSCAILIGCVCTINAQVYLRVGPGQPFTTIQAAFNTIPNPIDSTYHITLEAGYNFAGEVLPITLSNRTYVRTTDSLYIYPNVTGLVLSANNVATMFSVSGYTTNRYILDGRVGATGTTADLQLVYAITGATPTPDAAINGMATVRYCKFSSSNSYGPILTFCSRISHCSFSNITAISAKPKHAILGMLDTKLINDNTFVNFSDFAITYNANRANRNDTAHIYNNHFYHTEPMAALSGIFFTSPSGSTYPNYRSWLVKNNYIGGTAPFCQGAQLEVTSFKGVDASSFYGYVIADSNFIQNVSITSNSGVPREFQGLRNLSYAYNNTIGSNTQAANLSFTGNNTTVGSGLTVFPINNCGVVKYNTINGILLKSASTNIGSMRLVGIDGGTVVSNTVGGLINGEAGIAIIDSAYTAGNKWSSGIDPDTRCDSNTVHHIALLGHVRLTAIGQTGNIVSSASVNYNHIHNIHVNSTDSVVFRAVANSQAAHNIIEDINVINPNGGVSFVFYNNQTSGNYVGNTIRNINVTGRHLNSDRTFTFAIAYNNGSGTNTSGSFINNLVEDISVTGGHRGFSGVYYTTTATSISTNLYEARSNIFRNINVSGSDSAYIRGIFVGAAAKLNDNLFEDINVQANRLIGCNMVYLVIGGAHVQDNIIRNINLSSATADSAWFHGLRYNRLANGIDTFVITGNTITNVTLSAPNCNKTSFTGYEISKSNNNQPGTFIANFFAGNVYTPLSGTGYYFGIKNSSHYLIANNVLQMGNNASGVPTATNTRVYGIHHTSYINNPIHYNTVSLSGTSNSTLRTSALISSVSIISYGNMLSNTTSTTGGSNQHLALSLPNAFSGTFSNNLFWVNAANGGAIATVDNNSTFINTLPNLQTAMPGQHQASLYADPLLSGPALDTAVLSYRPSVTSPLYSAGLPVAAVSKDFFDFNRNASAPTIGAIEFGGNAMPVVTGSTFNCSADSLGTVTLVQPNADVWDSVRLVTSGGQVVDVHYNFTGTYQFTNLGAGTYTVELYTGASPVRTITVTVAYLLVTPNTPVFKYTPFCTGVSFTLNNDTHVTGYTNYWYSQPDTTLAPDTTTARAYIWLVMPSTPQPFYLRAKVSGSGVECFSALADTIINPLPANPAPTLVGGGDTINLCYGVATLITVTATGTVTWYTAPTGGTPINTGTSYSRALTGNTVYYVQAQDACLSPRVPIYAEVFPFINNPQYGTNNTLRVCFGSLATVNFSPGGGLVARWYLNPTGGSPFYTGNSYTTGAVNADNTYYVEYYSPSSGCKSSSRTAIEIDVITVGFSGAADSIPVCPGATYTYNLGSQSTVTYAWYTTPTGGTPFHTQSTYTTPPITTPQTYYIDATRTVAPLCSTSRTKTTVYPRTLPPPPTPVEVTVTVCEFEDAHLQVAPRVGTSFQWYEQGSSILLTTNNNYTYANVQEDKTFEIYAVQSGCRSALAAYIYALVSPDPPSISIVQNSSNPKVLMCTPDVFATYEWTYNSVLFAGQGSSIIADLPGFYSVTAYNQYGCEAYSGNFFFNPVGIGQVAEMVMGMQPNPASGSITFGLAEPMAREGVLSIYDMGGALVSTHAIPMGEADFTIDVRTLPEGTYIAKLVSENGTAIGRFVKMAY